LGLNEELLAMRQSAREFTEKEIVPHADKWDEEYHFSLDVIRKMADLGFSTQRFRRNTDAKYFAAEAVVRSAHSAMKILGAYGYSTEYPAARHFRDAVLYQIVEGRTYKR